MLEAFTDAAVTIRSVTKPKTLQNTGRRVVAFCSPAQTFLPSSLWNLFLIPPSYCQPTRQLWFPRSWTSRRKITKSIVSFFCYKVVFYISIPLSYPYLSQNNFLTPDPRLPEPTSTFRPLSQAHRFLNSCFTLTYSYAILTTTVFGLPATTIPLPLTTSGKSVPKFYSKRAVARTQRTQWNRRSSNLLHPRQCIWGPFPSFFFRSIVPVGGNCFLIKVIVRYLLKVCVKNYGTQLCITGMDKCIAFKRSCLSSLDTSLPLAEAGRTYWSIRHAQTMR